MRIEEVVRETGMGKSSIWLRVKEGRFPQPVRHGQRCTRWLEDEIEAWKAALIAERDGPKPKRNSGRTGKRGLHMTTNSTPLKLKGEEGQAGAVDPAPARLEGGEGAAAVPSRLSARPVLAAGPNPELMARGWEQFKDAWGASADERPSDRAVLAWYLKRPPIGVLVFDNRMSLGDGDFIPHGDGQSYFPVAVRHDGVRGIRWLRAGGETEEEALQIGSAVALAFEEAGHVPETWLRFSRGPKKRTK